MHKQRKKRRGETSLADANDRISQAARTSILGLASSIDGGEDFATAYLKDSYRSKFCDERLVPAAIRRENALAKWRECESRNSLTNLWFREVDPGFNIMPRVTVRSFLRFARRLTREILGPLRDEVVLGSFSGGASTSRSRTRSHPALKFVGKADITEEALVVLPVLYRLAPLLLEYNTFSDIRIVEGNVFFTVPKKTDIDRCACKEPDINMFLQKGVGKHIRRRLRRFGINLNDQTINRNLAYQASKDDSLATIDMSSASDLMSTELVKTFLPPVWFEYLNSIRSHTTDVDGETTVLEMFSSMGNGFTFELESLLFFVISRTVSYFEGVSGIISVYGDDIIVPSRIADILSFVLTRFGFRVNEDKSFSSGPFRESCGGHYYNGEDVTPFYLKREPERLTDLIRVANQFRRWLFATPFRRYEIPNAYSLWRELADFVPSGLWGGSDYSLDTQLVGPARSSRSYVLQRVKERTRIPDLGRYLSWQNSNWHRTTPIEDINGEAQSTIQKCRKRRTKPGDPRCEELFIEELL